MNQREERGLVIAATCKVAKTAKGDSWVVPSQSGAGKYYVKPDKEAPTCTCPDHQEWGHTCKHIHAVQIVIQRELFPNGIEKETRTVTITETVERKSYPQDWKNYNEAQVNEKEEFLALLRDLCDQVKEPAVPAGRGRPRIPMSDAIFMACFKVYSMVSQRRFMTDLREAQESGMVERVPHFNQIGDSLDNEALTPLLEKLILAAAEPLKEIEVDFAVDSTGFTSSRFHRWYDHKYGKQRQEHDWVKAHAMIGVKTNAITAVEIHGRNTNDGMILPSLLNTTNKTFTVKELSADNAYSTVNNFEAIAAAGVSAYIPFRKNTTGAAGGLFAKAFHYFTFHREEFLCHYHKRSNAESTFSMIKAKFGDSVRSKTDVAMKNEVLCKILCHNICCLISAMYELGLKPVFDKMIACRNNHEVAGVITQNAV